MGQWAGVTTEGGYVTRLDLGSNNLTEEIPARLGSLGRLQSANLRGNRLTGCIPDNTRLRNALFESYNRRKRVSLEELNFLREESRKSGQRAGLICPACVKKAFDNPEEYDIDIPPGELVVEAAKETPRWRICFTPDGLR